MSLGLALVLNVVFVYEVQEFFAGGYVQLRVNVSDVGTYGVFGQEKFSGDVAMVVSATQVVENFGFAR